MGTLPSRNNASFERRNHSTDNVLPTRTQNVTLTILKLHCSHQTNAHWLHVAPTEIWTFKSHYMYPRGNCSDRTWAALHTVYIPPEPDPILSLILSLKSRLFPCTELLFSIRFLLWTPVIMSVIYFNILAKHFLTHTLVRLIYTLQVESCQDSLFPRRRISISSEGSYSRDPTLLISQQH